MVDSPPGRAAAPADSGITDFIHRLHEAIAGRHPEHLAELLAPDAFILGATADFVAENRDEFVTRLQSRLVFARNASVRLCDASLFAGQSESGRSAWFLDRFTFEIIQNGAVLRSAPIRLTGLLVREGGWRLAAAFFSVPVRSNEYSGALLRRGKISPGTALEDRAAPGAEPLKALLERGFDKVALLPGLMSTRSDAICIGSTVHELFFGAEGKSWLDEIVRLPVQGGPRGGIRAALSPDGSAGWTAFHLDVTAGVTIPYRFFYIWRREGEEWKSVISHDGVSVNPANRASQLE